MVLLLVMSGFVLRVFHLRNQLYQGIIASHREDHWYRFRVVRFVKAIVVLAGLMLFTLGGYFYTRFQIGRGLI